MIPIDAPNTLLLGVWVAEGRCAIVGSVRGEYGDMTPDVLACAGEPWTALAQALAEAEVIDVRNVVILSNDKALTSSLQRPFTPPAPDRIEAVWYGRGDRVDVGVGGNAKHWQVLQKLGGRWGGRFRVMQVSELPKARELWQQQQ